MTFAGFKTFRGQNPMLNIDSVAAKLKIGVLQAVAWDARLNREGRVPS